MNKNLEVVRDWYDQHVDEYLQSGDVLFQDLLDVFLGYVPEGGTILDMGSGTGRDVDYFHRHGYVATGIDLSEKMIDHAKKNFSGTFVVGDFIDTGFEGQSFDAIWSSSALLTHLGCSDMDMALDEVARIVKVGGIFGGIVKAGPGGMIGEFSKKGFVFNRYSEEELRNFLESKGIHVEFSKAFDHGGQDWIFFVAHILKRTKSMKRLG